MGYPSISDFDEIFIKRTLANISKPAEYEFTQLINSLTGLIVLPRQGLAQNRRQKLIFNNKLKDFDEFGFLSRKDNYINDLGKEEVTFKIRLKELSDPLNEVAEPLSSLSLTDFLDKLRHSICHFAIRPTKDGDSWKGVVFRNYSGRNNKQKELKAAAWSDDWIFQLFLTEKEVLGIATFIARTYIKE